MSEKQPSKKSYEALSLRSNPLGHDPKERKPWGSAIFVDENGVAVSGLPHGLAQYFFDGDVYVVMTVDGKVVHLDESGNFFVFDVPVEAAAGWDDRYEGDM